MPCDLQVELVQLSIQREADVEVSDHADLQIHLLPVLPRERLDDILREELVARGWTATEDGTLTKKIGDAVATLPPGSRTIRITLSSEASVTASAEANKRVARGTRDEVVREVEAQAASKLAAAAESAQRRLEEETAERLLTVWRELRGEIDAVTTATTRRSIEQRAAEIGTIESIEDGQGEGGYELTITVKT